MKKTIQSIIGSVLILIAALAVFGVFSNSKEAPKKKNTTSIKTVTTEIVTNKTMPIKIKSTGSILAKDRTVLYSEVTGVFEKTDKEYKSGVSYNKGQALIRINNVEYTASVKSQRINFQSLIIGLLADIEFDYPAELTMWKKYAHSISVDKNLPALPSTNNENFKNYLSVKSVFSNYYTIKNLETRLAKYNITAPFSGVLVSADITPGTLVSPGQKLGEFIKPGIYELELNVNASLTDYLKVGKTVNLFNTNHTKSYSGKVSRINSKIDRTTQTIQLFVEVKSSELNEGEYLEADIDAKAVADVYEIDRNLIVDQNYVFVLVDGALLKQQISIIHSNENTVLVKGLKDKSTIISTPVPGGYNGMQVTVKN